jgi:hypothetical protein
MGCTHLAITVELVHGSIDDAFARWDRLADLPPILPWWGPRVVGTDKG